MTDAREIEHFLREGGEDLFAMADIVRHEVCGDAVHLRGIIEFSNVCSRNCFYCGLRRQNATLPRYRMTRDEVLRVVEEASKLGVRTIVLQSGENDAETPEEIAGLVSAIKRDFDVAVTLCIGVKETSFYRACREAGADRYLLKHETASPDHYRRLHPDSRLEDRLHGVERLRGMGYQVGSGGIVGLPGQTCRDMADDIMLALKLDLDMAAFGPFVPHPDTPLANAAAGSLQCALRVVAIARVVLGAVHVPATTAFDAIAPDGREQALRCGANVIMANLTPDQYRRHYEIYPSNRALNTVERVKAMLDRLGRPLAQDPGHSLKRASAAPACA